MARKKTIPTEEPEQLHPPENPEETAGEAAVSEFPLDGDDAECIFGAAPPEVLETQEGGPEQPPEKPEEGKEAAGDGDTPPADAASAAPAPILDLSDTEQREEEIPQETTEGESAASQEETSEVFSVDISETAPAPAGGETPEDLDRLLEDPAGSGSVVPQTTTLTPVENTLPGDVAEPPAPPVQPLGPRPHAGRASGVELHLCLLPRPQRAHRHHHRCRSLFRPGAQSGDRHDGEADDVLRHRGALPCAHRHSFL